MNMRVVLVSMLIGSFAMAEGKVYTCKQGKSERQILVVYQKEGSEVPCEVKYKKEGESEGVTKWSATTEKGYCEKKAEEFAEKLKGMGWDCQ